MLDTLILIYVATGVIFIGIALSIVFLSEHGREGRQVFQESTERSMSAVNFTSFVIILLFGIAWPASVVYILSYDTEKE